MAIAEAFNQPDLKNFLRMPHNRLWRIENTPFFVKQFTVGELNELEKYRAGRELSSAQTLALELHDENGNRVYDINNPDDMQILENVPAALYFQVLRQSAEVNSADFFSQQIAQNSATDKS